MENRENQEFDTVEDLQKRLKELEEKLSSEKENRVQAESLLKINPDTALPIYMEFLQDLGSLLEQEGDSEFCVALIRLDNDYQRIKNSKDRSKAILFRTTIQIREVVGDSLYQSDRLDEFIFVARGFSSHEKVHSLFASIIREVSLPHDYTNDKIRFSCNIGAAWYPQHGRKVNELLENAETALRYACKRNKKVVEYSPALGQAWDKVLRLEHDLHNACFSGFPGFHLVYQPFVNPDRDVKGCETLIRWNHPEFGFIPPPKFIPITERNGDILLLGRWILYQSLMQLKAWNESGYSDIFVSVNLSPVQFKQKDLVSSIAGLVESQNLLPEWVKLEITEGALMSNPEASIKILNDLRKLGFSLSIDDFGTGYSSLNYLRKLPVQTIKIDKSFVDDLVTDAQSRSIVKAIITLAKSLDMNTLAEGVETSEQRDFLINEGCNYIQGYYYSKPVTADIFTGFLQQGGFKDK